jgi:hypothetical protein
MEMGMTDDSYFMDYYEKYYNNVNREITKVYEHFREEEKELREAIDNCGSVIDTRSEYLRGLWTMCFTFCDAIKGMNVPELKKGFEAIDAKLKESSESKKD